MTRVVNIRREPYDVYIGRPGHGLDGRYGNPIEFGARCQVCGRIHWDVRDRGQLLDCYDKYLRRRVVDDVQFRAAVERLSGRVLGCWCKPAVCHGDSLAWIADYLAGGGDASASAIECALRERGDPLEVGRQLRLRFWCERAQ